MNQKPLTTLGCAALTAALLLSGLDLARADDAPAPVKVSATRPSVVPSPKGDGSQMNPMRRTQSVDRQKAANSAMERKKASEAAGAKGPVPPQGKPGAVEGRS
jgi:hypothetical protein